MINITCPNCNFSKQVSREMIPAGVKNARCPRCSKTFEIPVIPEQDSSQGPPLFQEVKEQADPLPLPEEITEITAEPVEEGHYNPIQEEQGYFAALYMVFSAVLFSPVQFFRAVKEGTGIREAMIFGILTGSIGAMFSFFWGFYLQPERFLVLIKALQGASSVSSIFMMMIIFSPLIVFINALIVTAVVHVSLSVMGGASKGFDSTMKVILYSNAASLFNIFPYLGGLIAYVLSLMIIVKGLREVHETGSGKAVLSLLLPVFVLLFLSAAAVTYLAGSLI
ncbi:MAG: hypothetical protein GX846_04775 [Deltaproteobacteria bacterium]|nr:hypothetical protein [Deltaproteobacteria bacterium]